MKLPTALILCAAASVDAILVTVSDSGGIPLSPLQYGIMFEDINHSGDGGLYAELIQNRAFQGDSLTTPTVKPWSSFGDATLTLQTTSPPLSSALPRAINVKGGMAGTEIGLSNPGYWGIDVQPQTYTGSFYVMGEYSGIFTAALREVRGGAILAAANITAKSVAGAWTKHSYSIVSISSSRGANAEFTLTWTPYNTSQSLSFNLVSLFPPTYRGHGLRMDLMQALADLKPSFLRFPGGNNLEGERAGSSWQWHNTIGDITQRPGRTGDWGYMNTDGLGLIEYLLWCQDLNMEPVLAFFAGLYLDKTTASQENLGPFVQDALDQLEFLMGNASTALGARRIALGYREPFQINYVEIGNEDNLNNGLASYNSYRFKAFYNAIIAKYPDMNIIASTPSATNLPGAAASDFHEYSTPDKMATQFTLFDKYSTSHKTLVGEYAVTQGQKARGADTDWALPFQPYPWFVGAVAEAIFEMGAERNADKIIGLSYAPLLMNTNDMRWKPDLIAFNADPSQTTLSTSYQRIKLFSTNRVTTVLPVKNSEQYGPAYWVAGVNDKTKTYVFKAAVYNTTANQDFTLAFPSLRPGQAANLTVLTAPSGPYAMNKPGQPEVTNTKVSTLVATDRGYEFSLPQWSIALLTWTPSPLV